MALDTNERQGVVYFIGTEVERTVKYGEQTLFVVDVQKISEIDRIAKEHDIDHIYLGTSQTFLTTEFAIEDWNCLVEGLLDLGYWVTVDFGVEFTQQVTDQNWNSYDKFIPMISVKIPDIDKYNKNAAIKLDDTTWGHSNSGVWVHNLDSLKDDETFTDWDSYTGDTEVD